MEPEPIGEGKGPEKIFVPYDPMVHDVNHIDAGQYMEL